MANTVILCVDDDESILDTLTDILEEAGYAVILARTGLDALALAYSQKPDLILLDLLLPDMPGEEVCRRLRLHHPTARTPIIMLTVKSDEVNTVRGLEIGADYYVTKPFSPKVLIARIMSLLKSQSLIGGSPSQNEAI
jgi:DNA-binding response OmpR family regulator